jgi:ornithine cyclodeaminase
MSTLIADREQVKQILSMQECIDAMEYAFKILNHEDVIMPLRTKMLLPDGESLMGWLPSYAGGIESVGMKVFTGFRKNEGTEYERHQGVVILFDAENGQLRAILDATAITYLRTGAVSGLATKLLAKPDASDLAIIGSGTQARSHLEAMRCVRSLRRVRVYSRSMKHSKIFAEQESQKFGLDIEVMPTAQRAVDGADIICTTTSAKEPVLKGAWVTLGAHINAVGAFFPSARELDTEAVKNARLYVDSRESAMAEAGDFIIPKSQGIISDDHIKGEISEVLTGRAIGRTTMDDITLFKSVGVAIEDLVSAHYILNKALENNIGTFMEINGPGFRPKTN